MNKLSLIRLFLISALIVLPSFSTVVEANSVGTGTLSNSLSLSYDPAKMEWENVYSSLETWPMGQIWNPYPTLAVAVDKPIYDKSPGWTPVPGNIAISSGGSSVTITSSINSTNVFNPSGVSTVNIAGYVSNDPSEYTYAFSDMLYYAGLRAIADGSFTVALDYDGDWSGSTENAGDYVYLFGNVQLSVQKLTENPNGGWIQNQVGYQSKYKNLLLENGNTGSLGGKDFEGQLFLTINFKEGDLFYIASSGANYMSALSSPSASVPEPATMLLLGLGILGLAGVRRFRK